MLAQLRLGPGATTGYSTIVLRPKPRGVAFHHVGRSWAWIYYDRASACGARVLREHHVRSRATDKCLSYRFRCARKLDTIEGERGQPNVLILTHVSPPLFADFVPVVRRLIYYANTIGHVCMLLFFVVTQAHVGLGRIPHQPAGTFCLFDILILGAVLIEGLFKQPNGLIFTRASLFSLTLYRSCSSPSSFHRASAATRFSHIRVARENK